MDGGEHAVALAQQAVQHQQRQGRLCRVGVDDDVAQSPEVLVTRGETETVGKQEPRPKQTYSYHICSSAPNVFLKLYLLMSVSGFIVQFNFKDFKGLN